MPQAAEVLTVTVVDTSPGNFRKISHSRRDAMRAALAGAALVALPVGVGPALAADEPDARFWKAWREFKALDAAWEATADDSEPGWSAWAAKVGAARDRMMKLPVTTVAAVLAKFALHREGEFLMQDGAYSSGDVVEWDLGRLAQREAMA